MITSLCFTVNASPPPVIDPSYTTLLQRSDDITYHGNYGIYSCGTQTQAVKNLLDLTYQLLQQAMDLLPSPVGNGGGSTVYNAFFNGVDTATVKALYQKITAGANITVNGGPHGLIIVCVNNRDTSREMRRAVQNCLPSSAGLTLGMISPGTPFVFLCPIWTSLPPFPLPYMCGTVGRSNTLTRPVDLAKTQYTTLIHELAHMYLGDLPRSEVYLPNDCIALPANRSVNNPQSYTFYAACG